MNQENSGKDQRRTICSPLISDKIIRQFPEDKDYNEYKNNVFSDFRFVKEFYPLLNICMLPTIKPREIFIYGWLLPVGLCNNIENEDDIEKFGIYIVGHYPSKYPEEDIKVEDICKMINWDLIPQEHRHIMYIDGRPTGLCTHHPYGEINDVPRKHRTVKILTSAWKLYYQCKQYVQSGIWDLKDLPHGDDALLILKREGYVTRTGRKNHGRDGK